MTCEQYTGVKQTIAGIRITAFFKVLRRNLKRNSFMALGGVRRNIIANYIGQGYAATAGILALPAYMHFMSAEAYGLIGFYTMLQAWFQLFDAGFNAALVREASRFNSGKSDAGSLIRLKQVFEALFALIGLAGIIVFLSLSETFARKWLNIVSLDFDEVVLCVSLMGPIIACRWQSCVYRSIISGLEQQVWLGGVTVVVATLRFILCIPVVALYPETPSAFFAYQIGAAFIEMAILWWKAHRELPRADAVALPRLTELRLVFRFTASIAFTNIIWVIITQTDKLILSRFLPLSAYGYLTVAAQLATGIIFLNMPISSAILPRMVRLFAERDYGGLREAYRQYSHLLAVALVPPTCAMVFMAKEILHAWTGAAYISDDMPAVLAIFAAGNCLFCLSGFSYYIQYAHGNVRLHMIGQGLFLIIYLPLLFLGIFQSGALGAAAAWLLVNISYFLGWVALTHGKFLDQSYISWLARDITPVIGASAAPFVLLLAWGKPELGRLEGIVLAACLGCMSLGAAILVSSRFRPMLFRWLQAAAISR